MWGSKVDVELHNPDPVVGMQNRTSRQLLRVNYKRPEHWRFWVGARLVDGTVHALGATDFEMEVAVDFILGVGRTNMTTQLSHPAAVFEGAFISWKFAVPNGQKPGQQLYNERYTTTGYSRGRLAATDPKQPIEQLVAQDIQAVATVVILTAEPLYWVKAEITAFVTPNVHLRPEWYDDDHRFRGDETGGT